MQLSGIMQARKKLLFAALFIAILVPIFFALALRSQLAVINPANKSPLITWLQQNMTSGGFWMKETGDGTSYSLVLLAKNSRIGTLLFLQSHACTVVTFILLWLTLHYKKYYLVPFTTAYALLSALIFLATMGDYNINGSAGQYCVLMLWGAYIREARGLGSVLVYLAVVISYLVSIARSRKENRKGYLPVQDTE